MTFAASRPRARPQVLQLRSTEPSEEMRMPSMSKSTPLQRMVAGVERPADEEDKEEDAVIFLFYDGLFLGGPRCGLGRGLGSVGIELGFRRHDRQLHRAAEGNRACHACAALAQHHLILAELSL